MSLPPDLSGKVASSVTSYGVGLGGMLTGLVTHAQDIAALGGAMIVLIRLTYDIVRLYRYLRYKVASE